MLNDEKKNEKCGTERHGHGTDSSEIAAQGHCDTVKQHRNTGSREEPDGRKQHLRDDAKNSAEEQPELIKFGRSVCILSAPENTGSNESENHSRARTACFNFYHQCQEHDGEHQNLKHRHFYDSHIITPVRKRKSKEQLICYRKYSP